MTRKLLVAYSTTSTHVQTTLDYLTAFRDHSGYDTSYLHVTHQAHIALDFDAAGYDVVFHNYCSRFCFGGYVSSTYSTALKRFSGLKVLAIQDEYDHTNKLKEAIKEHGFHIVLTCVPQNALEFVYPSSEFPGVNFITVFTGYVPEGFAAAHKSAVPLRERPVAVGYRGRDIGARYGRLGYEKYEIGRRMKEICDTVGISNDIAMTEESRIYGKAWFDFIGNCRSMLGSESGSNVFDFDGSIQAQYNDMKQRLGRPPLNSEFYPVVSDRDKQIDMGQISPKIFECAVMRTPMVLFRGRYSDAIEAGVHYIPLELDFSNAREVLASLEDFDALELMADRTYQHLVASNNFSYRTYVGNLVVQFDKRLASLRRAPADSNWQVAAAPDEKQQVLREVPSAHPKGMEEYKAKQKALANLDIFHARLSAYKATLETVGKLSDQSEYVTNIDYVYLELINKYQTEIERLSRFWHGFAMKRIPGYKIQSEDNIQCAKVRFDTMLEKFLGLRNEYRAERSQLIEKLKLAKNSNQFECLDANMIGLAKLDQEWIALYFGHFNEIQSARYACVKAIDSEANHRLIRNPLLRGYYWANRINIRSKDSKLEFAKAAASRIPGARHAWSATKKAFHKLPRVS